jgi:uncharacterized transporter YbjL
LSEGPEKDANPGEISKDFVINLLSRQPLMTLFLTVAIGYLLGGMNIRGFSLGAGAVLFVGPGTNPPALQAAIAAIGNNDPAVGYAMIFPGATI